MDELSRRLDGTKKKKSELEYGTIEITQCEQREIDWRKKREERKRERESATDLRN